MIKDFFLKIIDRIRNSSFAKNVLTLSAGIVISQAISLLTSPIVSRIYNPDVLGDFSIISSNSTIISTVICMGLMSAIMLPNDDDEAKGLCRLLTKLILGGATLFLIAALLLSNRWKMFTVGINYPSACVILWSIVILQNINSVCYGYINRQKLYSVMFWNPSLGTITNAAIKIVLGLMGFGLWGYLWGQLISSLLVILHMLHHANPFGGNISFKSWSLLKKYKDFPLVLLPSNLIGTLSLQLPVQMLSRFWGSYVLGSYTMCMNIMNLPKNFLAGPVNRVFYREATEKVNRGENIGEFALTLVKTNVFIAVIPVCIVVIFGRLLFSFVFGVEWADAGDFASVMGVYILLSFSNTCLSGKFVIIGRKKTILLLNIFGLILNVTMFMICHFMNLSALSTILVFSITGGALSIFDLSIFMKQTGVPLNRLYGFVFKYLLLPILICAMIRIWLF